MHLPTKREELTARIADCLGDLASIYCAGGESTHDLDQRLCRLSVKRIREHAKHLQAFVDDIV